MVNSSSSAKATRIRAGQRDAGLANLRSSFLAEAGKILASSLDYEKTLATVADLMVPGLADWCFIYTLDEEATPTLIAVSHSNAEKVERAWELNRAFPIAMNKSGGTAAVVQSKLPILIADDVPEVLAERASSPEHLQAMLGLGICSLLIVPLIARDRVLGTLTLAMAESGVHYNEEDQEYAMELATRAAIAIDNARLYREAQEAVQEKDEALALLHAVLQQMPAGVIIAGAPDGNIMLRNQVATEFWINKQSLQAQAQHEGLTTEFAFTTKCMIGPGDLPLHRALQSGETRVGEEIELAKPDGGRCFIRVNSGPIRDREGKIVAAAVAFEDVTQQRFADRALRESEEKFRSLAEVAPCSIFIHDNEKFLYVNNATCEITGYSRAELLAIPIWDVLHPESVVAARKRLRRRTEGQSVPSQFEERIVSRDGSVKWISFNGGTIQYEDHPAVICVALDVTERRHMDEKLRLSQERVRLASESAGISSWEWDIRSNLVIWSPEAFRIFGLANDADSNISFDQFLARIHQADRQRVREAIESAVSRHTDMSVEFRIKRRDDTYGWAYSRAKMFYDKKGQPERMVGVGIDITADKLAEAAIRESEERFRVTFNQAAVGMCQLSPEGAFLMVNQKFEEILGYREIELLGRKFQEFTHPDDLNKNLEKLDSMLSGDLPSYVVEKRYVRRDGSQRWVQVTASLVRDEAKQPKYIVAVIEDITERRRAAEALRDSERLAATGRLAATIAHEINNPLEAVTNILYLLEQNKSLDQAARGFATMAQEELSRVAHIARQTLGFYRDSTRLEAVQVSRLMDEVVTLFAAKVRTNNVELTKELKADAPIDAFPGELRQVFSNLVANALDAVGKKGKLRIRITPSRSRQNRSQRGVRLTIADNGPGIARADLANIFQPFFTTKGAKGTGLGLWVTRGIVEKHGGTIRVWSSKSEGKSGTVFSVFLPQKQKQEVLRQRTLSQVG
jgi:PAS domain S-box-containing protein